MKKGCANIASVYGIKRDISKVKNRFFILIIPKILKNKQETKKTKKD